MEKFKEKIEEDDYSTHISLLSMSEAALAEFRGVILKHFKTL